MMINNIFALILVISLLVTLFMSIYTFIYWQSLKRIYFLLLTISIFLFVLGYLLEITAVSADGGYTAAKVMYLGSALISPIFLLFIADYCEVKFKKLHILAILLIIPLIVIILVWTTDLHGLYYASYTYTLSAPVHHLVIIPGPFYCLNYIFSFLCIMASIIILANRIIKWDKKYRGQLLLLLLGALVPVFANCLFLSNLNLYEIYYTPIALVIVEILFYINIIRNDLFDILPRASIMALSSMKEAFVLMDNDMGFLEANPAAYRLLPGLSKLSKGNHIGNLTSWPQELIHLNEETKSFDIQFSILDKIHNFYRASVNTVNTSSDKRVGWFILIQDITDNVIFMKRLEEEAYTDGLTGIYNRRHFIVLAEAHLAQAHRTHKPWYIIMFDLDHFKNINDRYGHLAGDEVLKIVTTRVRNTLRSYDLFARYGGEEFVILITETNELFALSLAERLRSVIEQNPCQYENISIQITASFGIASGLEVDSLESALKNADIALYQAKNEGRNRVTIYKPEA